MPRKYNHSEDVRQVWWPNRRHAYSPEFQRVLDETMPADGIGRLNDLFDDVHYDA
jgi:hypothetical protein